MKKLFFVLVTLITIALAVMIFGFSSQNGDTSGQLSRQVTLEVLRIFYPSYDKLPTEKRTEVFNNVHLFVRKAAHFSEYLLFGFFLLLWNYLFRSAVPLLRHAWIAFVFGAIYAMSDEWHQGWVGGRSPQLRDVLIDSLGVITGVVFCSLVLAVLHKRHKTSESSANANPVSRRYSDVER